MARMECSFGLFDSGCPVLDRAEISVYHLGTDDHRLNGHLTHFHSNVSSTRWMGGSTPKDDR